MVTKQKLRTTLVILIVKLRNIILSGIFKSKYVTYFIPLSANPTKWSNTLKQFFGKLRKSCLSVFDHFAELALKGLRITRVGTGDIIIMCAIMVIKSHAI